MKKENDKKSILPIIVIILIILLVGVACFFILRNDGDKNKEKKPISKNTNSLLLSDDLNVEINSETKLLSLVSEDNKVKVLSEDEEIDTSKLGEVELTIKYEVNGKEEEKTFKIKVVDTIAPTIEYKKELSTKVGKKIDLLKNVIVSDNSKEKITATVEGEYDFKKEGSYKLKYVAVDSSNNKKEEEFTLRVGNDTTTTTTKKTTDSKTTTSKKTTTTTKKASDTKVTLEEYDAEFDRLEAVRVKKNILYTYDPTKEIIASIDSRMRSMIEPLVYKRVYYYTCEQKDGASYFYTQCDGGDKGCSERAVKEFMSKHPSSECDMSKGVSPKYTFYVHSGFSGMYKKK